jgi:hypothetical protein
MEHIDKTVTVATGVKDDIIQFQFYKNPVFIVISLYTIFIFGSYLNMTKYIKDSYVFNDKFRDDIGHIYWLDIISYPYDFSKSTANKVKIMSLSPIILYLFIGTYIIISFIDPLQPSNQAYFYTIMFSFLLLLILFSLHVFIVNFIIQPENVNVELRLGDANTNKKTYSSFYRTQWVLLFTLSPIYISIVVYIIRRLNKGKLST